MNKHKDKHLAMNKDEEAFVEADAGAEENMQRRIDMKTHDQVHEPIPSEHTPRVFIAPYAKQKLDAYIRNCPHECSGLGTVHFIGSDIVVSDVFLLKQKCSAASTELDEEALALFYTEMLAGGTDPSLVRLWWHSHCNFDVLWSSTDTGTIEQFSTGDWFLSIVGNKHGKYRARLDLFQPARISLDNLPIEVFLDKDLVLEEIIRKEITDKVSHDKLTTRSPRGWHKMWAKDWL